MMNQAQQAETKSAQHSFFHDFKKLSKSFAKKKNKKVFSKDLQNGFESRMISILRR